MAKQPDDTLLQFLCIHRPATFTFGMPRGKARERAASISAQIAAAGKDTADVRSDAEAVLRHNIEHGLHMDPGRQQEAATTILWLTLTGEAAKETADAEGYVLEFSNSELPSRSADNVTINLRYEDDQALRPRVHYWTDTAAAVVKLCEDLRKQADLGARPARKG